MNLIRTLKTIGAVMYKKRATIETVVGGALIIAGTGVIMSKAKDAVDVADEVEYLNTVIKARDEDESWTSKKERSDEVKLMLKTAVVGYSRTYWLGTLLELGGLTLIAISDVTQAKELSAVSALLATTSATLSAVKERVIADQGEEKWQEYLLGPQYATVEVLPDGTVVETTTPLDNKNRACNLPPHCIMFDECNPNWEKFPYANKDFLEDHLRWLNEKLYREGFLFENDIRRDIGAPIVKAGWTSGIFAEDEDGNRNYLSFGLDAKNPAAQRFRDGVEPSFIIQLNVEDNILEKLKIELS